MEYKQVSSISNSKLSEIKRIINGQPAQLDIKQETLDFGTQFHLAVLQPERYDFDADPFAHHVRNMAASVMENVLFSDMLSSPFAKKEHEHYWTCKTTDVKCKGKLDLRVFKKVSDLKTTSAKNAEDFKNSILSYDADRQAAFYFDGADAEEFIFVGVQKRWPYKTFTYTLYKDDPKIQRGRDEYIFLIRQAISMGIIKSGFGTREMQDWAEEQYNKDVTDAMKSVDPDDFDVFSDGFIN